MSVTLGLADSHDSAGQASEERQLVFILLRDEKFSFTCLCPLFAESCCRDLPGESKKRI